MKKLNLLLVAFVALFAISCNNTTPEAVEEEITEEVVMETETVSTEVSVEVPTFENEEFNTFAQDMDVLMNETIALLIAGDQEGLAAIEERGKALQEKGQALQSTISEEDKALFEGYMKEKAKELMNAAGLNLSSSEENIEEIDHSGHNH